MQLACEGAAAFLLALCSIQRVFERLDFLEGTRVSLVEEATGSLEVQTDQIGRIEAKVGEPPALRIIDGNHICQPMDALENDSRLPLSTGMPLPPQGWRRLPR